MIEKNFKIKLSLFIVFVSVIVLVILCVFLESLGFFPGSLLNKFGVQRYINENYPDLEYRIENYYYDKQDDRYVFNCTFQDG